MKKTITIFVLLLAFFMVNTVFAYTVDGYAYLQNQADHSGITVAFERIAPDSWNGSTSTNPSGYYIIDVDFGAYDITYTKDDYFNESIAGILINSNTTLTDVNLWEHVTILNVPSIFSTIQEGIDRAWEGDTVLVEPGIYYENINFSGKNITVASLYQTTVDEKYIETTIIDANNSGRGVTFRNNENSSAVLKGFTITNGSSSFGAGIYCFNSSPMFSKFNNNG